MTDAELKAAERVRQHAAQLGNVEIADRNTLVLAWLREHPADDGEAVTAEWLKAVGFGQDDRIHTAWALQFSPHEPEHNPDDNWCIVYQSDGFYRWRLEDDEADVSSLPDMPTRGHVRRLCAALGITLQEPKQ